MGERTHPTVVDAGLAVMAGDIGELVLADLVLYDGYTLGNKGLSRLPARLDRNGAGDGMGR